MLQSNILITRPIRPPSVPSSRAVSESGCGVIFGYGAPQPVEVFAKLPTGEYVDGLTVSNKGNIYVLGKFYRENRIKSPEDFGFRIYKYAPGASTGEHVSIELENHFITDLTFKVDRNENIFLAGFYSEQSTSNIIGTLFLRIDENLEIVVSSKQKFSEEFLAISR